MIPLISCATQLHDGAVDTGGPAAIETPAVKEQPAATATRLDPTGSRPAVAKKDDAASPRPVFSKPQLPRDTNSDPPVFGRYRRNDPRVTHQLKWYDGGPRVLEDDIRVAERLAIHPRSWLLEGDYSLVENLLVPLHHVHDIDPLHDKRVGLLPMYHQVNVTVYSDTSFKVLYLGQCENTNVHLVGHPATRVKCNTEDMALFCDASRIIPIGWWPPRCRNDFHVANS